MKIAIVSDSHDNIPNIDKMLAYCKKEKIKTVLHCGDLCARSVLRHMANNYAGDIYWIYGNVHGIKENMIATSDEFDKLHNLEDEGEVIIDKKKIYLVHYFHRAKEIAKTGSPRFVGKAGRYDLVFYGHNHKPWEETINKTRLVNPGTLAGMFAKATFAVYDTQTDKLELKLLEKL